MLLGSLLLVILILVSCDQIQGECSFPYRKIGFSCYYISTDTASWDEAYVKCLHKGGTLANIHSFPEFLILRSWIAGLKSGQHYSIGGREINDGDWRWVARDGRFSKLSHFVFSPSEPNGSKARPEKCTALYALTHYYAVDLSCNSVARYICEK